MTNMTSQQENEDLEKRKSSEKLHEFNIDDSELDDASLDDRMMQEGAPSKSQTFITRGPQFK